MEIYLRRPGVLMAEPEGDDRRVDAALEQLHGARVTQDVGCDLLGSKRWHCSGGSLDVKVDEALNGVGAEPAAETAGEEDVAGLTAALAKPDAEHGRRRRCQRGAAVLAPFAQTAHVRAGAKMGSSGIGVGAERGMLAGLRPMEAGLGLAGPGGRGVAISRGRLWGQNPTFG